MNGNELQGLAQERDLEGKLLRNEPLSRHTYYRIGGPADHYVVVEKEEQLCGWVKLARELKEPYLIIGRGTNLLVADKGFRGLIIENRCLDFTLDTESHSVHAEAGVPFALLARKTANHGLAGLEWAVGIPGTVGGAVVNNAGAYGGTVADVLSGVTILDQRGQIRELPPEELKLGYRTSRFKEQGFGGEAVLSTDFLLSPESTKVLTERMARYDSLRRADQPRKPSAGSVFKNPPGLSAGQLIEQAGLKGKRIGDAQVSPRHANFIVNLGSAKAIEVLDLIKLIRQEMWHRFGVELELEIELVGEWEKNTLAEHKREQILT
jgi:UDP-N-acetylmuramate dehydrogenase